MAFMRYKATGYSWVLGRPDGDWFLFGRGEDGALARPGGTDTGPLDRLDPRLAARSERYREYSEGALTLPDRDGSWQSLFFRGERCEWYDWDRGVVRECPWTELGTWGTALPAGYRSQIDALLQGADGEDGTWRTHLFKGPRVLTLDWRTGVVAERLVTEGPDPSGCAGWAGLPPAFRGDLDHVADHRPAADGTRRSLLVKGGHAVLLDWERGVLAEGAPDRLQDGVLTALPDFCRTPYRTTTGRWTTVPEESGGRTVEVRVDIDGERPLLTVSGDLYERTPTGTAYVDSFRAEALTVERTAGLDTITQSGVHWANGCPLTELTLRLPRVAATDPAADGPGTVSEAAVPDGTGFLGLSGSGRFLSQPLLRTGTALRTVELTTQALEGAAVFEEYKTSSGPAPSFRRGRTLTLASAYAEAGVEIRATGRVGIIARPTGDPAPPGSPLAWSDAELHAAVCDHAGRQRDLPGRRLWMFVATRHAELSAGGVMFDRVGSHGQGVALLADELRPGGGDSTAHELFSYVHQLGHALGLPHSWLKRFSRPHTPMDPGGGHADLSWMNCPHGYDNGGGHRGARDFFADFAHRFTDDELRHLRHAFHRRVVPGGDGFLTGAALESLDALAAGETFAHPPADESGLALTVGGKRAFAYGEPVMAELRLSRTGRRGDVPVAGTIGPRNDRTVVAVTGPSGRTRIFRPLARVCAGPGAEERGALLTERRPAVYESVYLGYGSDGLYFAEPGLYRVTAVHHSLDGSRVAAPTRTLRVRAPLDRTDQEVGELMTGDEQGALLALLGSDAPRLDGGNTALREVVERHGRHPLAVYARLVRGANAGRHFQTVTDGRLWIRPPDVKDAVAQLTHAVAVSRDDSGSAGGAGLDHLTLNAAMRRLALVHGRAGDLERADTVLDRLVSHFHAQGVPRHVQLHIQQQAARTREAIRRDAGEQPDPERP
ncbi:hypothetical protein I3J15_00960 [Streptomyces clavuligerus]|nr:hypothetical protein I3J15_00960 [Streptomyces clavuligerus]